jgi:hypothetical protein
MILGTSGRPMVELGGTSAHRQFIKGDIVCSLQWLDLGGEDGPEPCAALFPTSRRMEAGAFVVPQAKAYEYFTPQGNPTAHLMGAAFKACAQMGFHPDRSTVFRVIDVLTDAAPDLVKMPSSLPASVQEAIRKEGERNVMGIEATASVNGKVIAERVI